MRISPYERINPNNQSIPNNQTNIVKTQSTPTSTATKSNNLLNSNILSNLLSNPNSMNLIKNFLPLLSKTQNNNDSNGSNNNNYNNTNSYSQINTNSNDNSSNNTTKQNDNFPSINPQFSLDTLLNPTKPAPAKQDNTLNNSRQTLIKQMQLHQSMLNKINHNN